VLNQDSVEHATNSDREESNSFTQFLYLQNFLCGQPPSNR
jgi:hypothetical protein